MCKGHQKGVNFETRWNSFADETAKQAALTSEVPVFSLIPHLPALHVNPIFTPSEEEQLKNLVQSGLNRENGFSLMGGNDLKAPNERTHYLSPSGEPLGIPSRV
jgi:hypothetical protein